MGNFNKKFNKHRTKSTFYAMSEARGITLIVLIVTIIVLLILAGVTIANITGGDETIDKAHDAKSQHEKSDIKERIHAAVLSSATLEGEFSVADVKSAITSNVNNATVANNEFPLKVSVNNLGVCCVLNDGSIIDYEPKEYIKSTGTQYIDTGVNPSDKIDFEMTLKTDVDSMTVGNQSTRDAFFGAANLDIVRALDFNFGGIKGQKFIFTWKNKYYVQGNGVAIKRFSTSTYNPQNKITISCINDVWKVNGNTTGTSASVGDWKDEHNSLIVFGYSAIENNVKTIYPFYENMYLYSLKIWERDKNGNSTLLRDFLPVVSLENGHEDEPCLYDQVQGIFYYNQGEGTFETD